MNEEQVEELVATPGAGSILDELEPELVKAAMQRARDSLDERRRFEYQAWLNGEFQHQEYSFNSF